MPQAKKWNAVLPRLGYGAAHLGNLYAPITDTVADDILETATAGNAFVDTAPYYGHGLSEQRIGKYFRAHPDRRPMISTKVGRRLVPCDRPSDFGFVAPAPFQPVFDYSAIGIRETLQDSLTRLGRPVVDLILLHDIGSTTHGHAHSNVMAVVERETWPVMQELRNDRLAGAIGIGVNECDVVLECLDRGIVPDTIMLAGRHTLLDRGENRGDRALRCPWCWPHYCGAVQFRYPGGR
jgi:D-threo-aldose 1-dehydrogenase